MIIIIKTNDGNDNNHKDNDGNDGDHKYYDGNMAMTMIITNRMIMEGGRKHESAACKGSPQLRPKGELSRNQSIIYHQSRLSPIIILSPKGKSIIYHQSGKGFVDNHNIVM